MDADIVVQVRVQSYTYPGVTAPSLTDVNLDIRRGEYVLVVGPTGGGKSTLCRCLTGLIPHFYGGELEGRVVVVGQDMATVLPHDMVPRLAMVFQNPQDQLLAMRVEDDVAFGPQQLGLPRAEIRRRVWESLAAVGAEDIRLRTVYDLSAGQQQRVALAGALALRPEILILDEPTSQIDPATASAFLETVAHLNREQGMTVVVVEHRLGHVLADAHRLVIVADGRVAWDGPPRMALANGMFDSFGLAWPPVVRLAASIRQAGVVIDPPPVTVAEAAEQIGCLLGGR